MNNLPPGCKYIVAIDYGTTRSGYAWCRVGNSTKPNGVVFRDAWTKEKKVVKCSTLLLTDENGNRIEWGMPALINATSKTFLHQRVKMDFFDPWSNANAGYVDRMTFGGDGPQRVIRNCLFNSVDLVAHFLKCLKKKVLEDIGQNVTARDIYWLLTIPANSNDSIKHFMRQAAFKAGLVEDVNSESLELPSEPEMALFAVSQDENNQWDEQKEHIKVIIDAGGGTVDISTYKLLGRGEVRQYIPSDSTNAGSTYLNINFWEYLKKYVFPQEIITAFKKEMYSDYLSVEAEFEKAKIEFEPSKNEEGRSNDTFDVRIRYLTEYCETNGQQKWQNNRTYPDRYHNIQDDKNFTMPGSHFESTIAEDIYFKIFEALRLTLQKVVEKQRINEEKLEVIIYLLGGFGCSKSLERYLRNRDYNSFPDIQGLSFRFCDRYIGHELKDRAIMYGAVIYADSDFTIRSRIAKRTYGMKVTTVLTKANSNRYRDRPDLKYFENDLQKECIKHVFSPFVRMGDSVSTEQPVVQKRIIRNERKSINIVLYSVQKRDVTFIDDEGVEKIIGFTFTLIGTEQHRELELKTYFGMSELKLRVTEVFHPENSKVFFSPIPEKVWE